MAQRRNQRKPLEPEGESFRETMRKLNLSVGFKQRPGKKRKAGKQSKRQHLKMLKRSQTGRPRTDEERRKMRDGWIKRTAEIERQENLLRIEQQRKKSLR